MMTRQRNHVALPEIVNGYPLDDVWAVVVPVARSNLVINPSFETNTTGIVDVNFAVSSRSTAQQYHGAYSLAVAVLAAGLQDGIYYGTVSLVSGTTYAVSMKFLGGGGVPYVFSISTTAGVALQTLSFKGTGRWQWLWFYYTETATTTRRIYVTKNQSASTQTFYVDGLQVEAIAAGETVSTYIDGDQQGFVPNQSPVAYGWDATPHASTSYRTIQTRAGGMVVPFRNFGWFLTAIVGLGLALPQNVATEYARIDGGYDDYTRKPTRQFTLAGQFEGRGSYPSLRQQRSGLSKLLDRDLVGQNQRLLLMRWIEDECGVIDSTYCRAIAKYQGGLEGNTDNHYAGQAPITFVNYLPYVVSDGETAVSLTSQTTVTNANDIIQRSPAGVWSAFGTGANGSVNALVRAANGALYAGGAFTSMDGVANTRGIAEWSTTNFKYFGTAVWSSLGSGGAVGAVVRTLVIGPDGALYAGGTFTLMGGIANTVNIAKWSGASWSALGTGTNGDVNALAFGSDGALYATGAFTLAGGVANTARIAKWNGTAWSALGTGLDATGYALAATSDGSVYVGGNFTTANGVGATRIAKWNGTTFVALSSGMNATVYSLAVAPDMSIYAAGNFTTAGGVTVNYIARWNGVAWSSLGGGANAQINTIIFDNRGLLYVGGQFTTIGSISPPDSTAIWNGSTWLYLDTDLPIKPNILALATTPENYLYIGYDTAGSAVMGAITTVNNRGTGYVYPTIVIHGAASSASLYQIANFTTGKTLLFNLLILSNETLTLSLAPDNISFVSSFRGDVSYSILSGSNEADFFLQPGNNSISLFTSSSSVTSEIRWNNAYLSLDDVP